VRPCSHCHSSAHLRTTRQKRCSSWRWSRTSSALTPNRCSLLRNRQTSSPWDWASRLLLRKPHWERHWSESHRGQHPLGRSQPGLWSPVPQELRRAPVRSGHLQLSLTQPFAFRWPAKLRGRATEDNAEDGEPARGKAPAGNPAISTHRLRPEALRPRLTTGLPYPAPPGTPSWHPGAAGSVLR
jgi:hypothetical protein